MKKIGSRIFFVFLMFALSFSFVSAEDEFISPMDAWADSAYSSTYAINNAFDGNTATGWFTKAYPTYPASISFDFGEDVVLSGLDLYIHLNYVPVVFSVYSSDDNDTWNLILSDETVENGAEYVRFDFDNNEGLRFLKIEESSTDFLTYAGAIYEFRGVLGGDGTVGGTTCEDSDGGKDYSIKGTTSGIEWAGTNAVQSEDYCITEGTKAGRLSEFFCSNNQVASESYDCGDEKVCSDGACSEYDATSSYIIEKDFGEIAYEGKGDVSQIADFLIGGLEFVGGEWGHYDSSYTELDVIVVEYSEDIGFEDFYSHVNKEYAGMDFDFDPMEDKGYSLEDGSQVLFVRDYNKYDDLRGFAIWTSMNNYVVFEFAIKDGANTEDAEDALMEYLAKYKTSLVVDEDIFQCSNDYDCPSAIDKYCDGDEAVYSVSYSSCRNSKCEASGGSGYSEYCNHGCLDGECIEKVYPKRTLDSCEDLTDFIKSPYSFEDKYGAVWDSTWNYSYSDTWYYDGKRYPVESSYSHFDYNRQDSDSKFEGYMNFYYRLFSFDTNVTEVLEGVLNDEVENQVCSLIEEDKRVYYLCDNSVLYDQGDFFNKFDSYYSNRGYGTMLWISGNNLIMQSISYAEYYNYGQYFDDDLDRRVYEISMEVRSISDSQGEAFDFLSGLVDNRAQRVNVEDFYYRAPWELYRHLEEDMGVCLSDITGGKDVCVPSWNCMVNPVICPEHGYQTNKCVDLNGCFETKESQQECNPGICSGCTMNKWLGFGWSELYTKCMPYGARFDFAELSGGEDEIPGGSHGGGEATFDVEILNEYSAKITINNSEIGFREYNVWEDNMLNLNLDDSPDIYIKEIVYDESMDGNGKIIFVVKEESNAYCDYDGNIKEQKLKDYDGSWATCQNNFECHSNLCSSGECIELVEIMENLSGFKEIGIKLLCTFSNLFGIQEYDSCIAENLGQ